MDAVQAPEQHALCIPPFLKLDAAKRSSRNAQPQAKELRFGNYTLGQTLGEGEFGKVKLGWSKQHLGSKDNLQVAIKLIRRESVGNSKSRLNKIEREIKVLGRVRHPNIVRCYEVMETENYIGIVLEYASGQF